MPWILILVLSSIVVFAAFAADLMLRIRKDLREIKSMIAGKN